MAEGGQRIRWVRVLLVTLLGVAFCAAPFVLTHRDAQFGDWHLVLSSTLTNVGTAVLLVGVVLVLERGLVGRVGEAAAASTESVVKERTRELRSANEALATQLADLRADFDRAAAAESEKRTAPLRDVATDVSFDSVAAAMETANDHGALQGGVVVVPFVTPSDAPELVSLDWRYHELRDQDWMATGDHVAAIRVSYLATRNPGGGVGTPVVEVLWPPDQAPAEMLLDLRSEMTRRGFGQEAKLVGPDLLANVGQALADAVAGRTAQDGAWVKGQLSEWLADGWAVTDQGLVTRDHGCIPRSEFPRTRGLAQRKPFSPPAPDGVSEDFWRFTVDRACVAHGHGITGLPGAFHRGDLPQPFTPATSPRGR